MSNTVIPDKYLDLFKKKAFASLATLMPGGEPQVTPVWVDYDGRQVIVNTAAGRQKDANLQRDGLRARFAKVLAERAELLK